MSSSRQLHFQWTFLGQEGKKTRVAVYSVNEEVELLVNGISMGRKPAKETGRTSLKTTGAAAYLRLTADRPEIHSAFGDLAYVMVEIVDQDGCLVKWANPEVALEATGAGELITMGTANPMSEELYVGNQRKAWNGRLMAVVRSLNVLMKDEPYREEARIQLEGIFP